MVKERNTINVGSLKEDTSLSGLYFADELFNGLPKELRIKITDWKVMGQYDYDTKTWIDKTLGSIQFKAYDQSVLKAVEDLKNEAVIQSVLGSLQLMDFTISVPSVETINYKDLFSWVTNLDSQMNDAKNQGKDMIFEGCECHVAPLPAKGKGNFNKFQGVGLKLYNPLGVKVKFIEALS